MEKSPLKLYETLRGDHRRLDELFERLLNHVHVGDTALADATWTEFERGLTAHLSAEEKWLLTALERVLPAETAALRAEHEIVRAGLTEMGIELEIHTLREDTVERFIQFLRAHAAREDELLYQWADEMLAEEPRTSVIERLALAGARRHAESPPT